MGRFWLGLALFACIGTANASIRDTIEASMLVKGEIEVDGQGAVTDYELDDRDQLPDDVERFLDSKIAGWHFDPMIADGQPAPTRNRMGLLLVAAPKGDGSYRMELRDASFHSSQVGHGPEAVDMTPPDYPRVAARKGLSGTVYLILRIGKDGRVEEVMAEQVNLRLAFRRESEMEYWRGLLAEPTVEQAKKWTFRLHGHGPTGEGQASMTIRVPVAYWLGDDKAVYGQWQAYVPGPRRHVPWLIEDDGVAPGTLSDGGLYPVAQPGALHLPAGSFGG